MPEATYSELYEQWKKLLAALQTNKDVPGGTGLQHKQRTKTERRVGTCRN